MVRAAGSPKPGTSPGRSEIELSVSGAPERPNGAGGRGETKNRKRRGGAGAQASRGVRGEVRTGVTDVTVGNGRVTVTVG